MTANCRQIGNIVLCVETPFLDTPGLRLSAEEASRRFGVETATCQAVLDALAEAKVLTRTPEGVYRRYFPRRQSGGRIAA